MITRPIITLLTDFGSQDSYVGIMKGVMLSLNPEAVLVDLVHEVPPQDTIAGAFLLAEAAPYFPPGTIHLAVVDPGVGTPRRALAARAREQFWVGPDNGLFHLVFQEGPPPGPGLPGKPRLFPGVGVQNLSGPGHFRAGGRAPLPGDPSRRLWPPPH